MTAHLGLLSRAGPSMLTPGLLSGDVSLPNFSTKTLLTIPTPQPTSGTVLVPVVREEGLQGVALTCESGGDFRSLVERLFVEGERIAKAQSQWGLEPPYSLPETDGDWFIFDLSREGNKRHLSLKGLNGRLFALDHYDDGRIDVETGWFRGYQSSARQKVKLGSDDEVSTIGYSLEFYNGSADGLAAFLRLSKYSLAQMALELGKYLVASGQYPDLTEKNLTRKNLQSIERRGSALILPSAQLLLNRERGGAHVSIDLHRSPDFPDSLMRLNPDLLALWEGAVHHLHSYPY